MNRPADISPKDWTHLLVFLSELPDDKLTHLYEASERLSETAQLKLLKQAAERVKAKGTKKKAAAEISTDHSTRQGEEASEDQVKGAPKRRRRKPAQKQGTEKMGDAA